MEQQFVQIGVTAVRDPQTGEFLPSVPIYAEVTPAQERAEASTITDVARLFAGKMQQYIKANGDITRAPSE